MTLLFHRHLHPRLLHLVHLPALSPLQHLHLPACISLLLHLLLALAKRQPKTRLTSLRTAAIAASMCHTGAVAHHVALHCDVKIVPYDQAANAKEEAPEERLDGDGPLFVHRECDGTQDAEEDGGDEHDGVRFACAAWGVSWAATREGGVGVLYQLGEFLDFLLCELCFVFVGEGGSCSGDFACWPELENSSLLVRAKRIVSHTSVCMVQFADVPLPEVAWRSDARCLTGGA